MCFLKAFGTQVYVLTEIFFKQALSRYAAELVLFLFELCALLGTDKEREVSDKSLSACHPPSLTLLHIFASFVPLDQSLFISELPNNFLL